MSKQDIAVCGLRYGQTKYQAEQIKKYIEENSLTEIKITILDSESKQMLDKLETEIKTITKNIRQQPSEIDEDDEWILGRLDSFLRIIERLGE